MFCMTTLQCSGKLERRQYSIMVNINHTFTSYWICVLIEVIIPLNLSFLIYKMVSLIPLLQCFVSIAQMNALMLLASDQAPAEPNLEQL